MKLNNARICKFSQGLALFAVMLPMVACSRQAKLDRAIKSADGYYEAAEYDKAKIAYMQVLKLKGNNGHALQRLGLIWSKQGSPIQAWPYLSAAVERKLGSTEIREQMVLTLLSLSDIGRARTEALALLKQDPKNEQALLALGQSVRSQAELTETEAILNAPEMEKVAAAQLARANLFLRQKKLEEAAKATDAALKIDPNSSAGHMANGAILLMKGEGEKGAAELKKGAELAPVRSATRIKYAEFLAQKKEIEPALAEIDQVIKKANDFLPAWITRARLLQTKGNPDEALKALENVFSRDSVNYDARMVEAQILLAKGEGAKAREGLEKLDQQFANIPATQLLLAQACLKTNDVPAAIAVLEKATQGRPGFAEAVVLLSELQIKTGKADVAARNLQALLEARPGLGAAQLMLGQAYLATGRTDEALATAQELVKNLPKVPEAQFLLGSVLQQAGKMDEARQAYEKVEELKPGDFSVTNQLVELDLASKNLDRATERAAKFVEKNPDMAAAHYLAGRVHAAAGRWDQAEASLSKSLDIDPKFGPAYGVLGTAFAASNRLPEILAQLDSVLEKDPKNQRALMMSALVYEHMENYDQARAKYEKLLEVTPDSVLALNNLAYIYSEHLKKLDEAEKYATRANELSSGDASTADTLGWILFRKGEFAKAFPLLQESATKLAANPEVQYHFGMASAAMGMEDAARTALQKAADSTGDFRGKDEATKRLAMLKSPAEGGTTASSADLIAEMAARPNDLILKMRLGSAYENEGNAAKAAEVYQSALAINPALPDATLRLAELNLGPLKNADEGYALAKKARDLAPTNAKTAIVFGRASLRKGNASVAYNLLEGASGDAAFSESARLDLARAAFALGRIDEADKVLQKVAADDKDADAAARAGTFRTLLQAGQGQAEIEPGTVDAATSVLAKEPGDLAAGFVVARSLAEKGKVDDSKTRYEAIVTANSDFYPALRDLARLTIGKAGQEDRALELANKAHKMAPDDPATVRVLAAIDFQRGQFGDTRRLLEGLTEPNPPLTPRELFFLGMSQFKTKEFEKSEKTLNRAVEGGLEKVQEAEARKALEEMAKTAPGA